MATLTLPIRCPRNNKNNKGTDCYCFSYPLELYHGSATKDAICCYADGECCYQRTCRYTHVRKGSIDAPCIFELNGRRCNNPRKCIFKYARHTNKRVLKKYEQIYRYDILHSVGPARFPRSKKLIDKEFDDVSDDHVQQQYQQQRNVRNVRNVQQNVQQMDGTKMQSKLVNSNKQNRFGKALDCNQTGVKTVYVPVPRPAAATNETNYMNHRPQQRQQHRQQQRYGTKGRGGSRWHRSNANARNVGNVGNTRNVGNRVKKDLRGSKTMKDAKNATGPRRQEMKKNVQLIEAVAANNEVETACSECNVCCNVCQNNVTRGGVEMKEEEEGVSNHGTGSTASTGTATGAIECDNNKIVSKVKVFEKEMKDEIDSEVLKTKAQYLGLGLVMPFYEKVKIKQRIKEKFLNMEKQLQLNGIHTQNSQNTQNTQNTSKTTNSVETKDLKQFNGEIGENDMICENLTESDNESFANGYVR